MISLSASVDNTSVRSSHPDTNTAATATSSVARRSDKQHCHQHRTGNFSKRAMALALKAVAAREVREGGKEVAAAAAKRKGGHCDEQVARSRAQEKAKRLILRASRPGAMYGDAVAEANNVTRVGGRGGGERGRGGTERVRGGKGGDKNGLLRYACSSIACCGEGQVAFCILLVRWEYCWCTAAPADFCSARKSSLYHALYTVRSRLFEPTQNVSMIGVEPHV